MLVSVVRPHHGVLPAFAKAQDPFRPIEGLLEGPQSLSLVPFLLGRRQELEWIVQLSDARNFQPSFL